MNNAQLLNRTGMMLTDMLFDIMKYGSIPEPFNVLDGYYIKRIHEQYQFTSAIFKNVTNSYTLEHLDGHRVAITKVYGTICGFVQVELKLYSNDDIITANIGSINLEDFK